MDGIETEHRKKEKGTLCGRRPVLCGFRIAAAGLAGALLAANNAGAVLASQETDPGTQCVSGSKIKTGDFSAIGQKGIWWGDRSRDQDGEGSDRQSSDVQSVLDWDEQKILERWGLDPDDFPSEEDIVRPDIPDEYLPYFEEMTSEAVSWYAGAKPPAADLSKYSARADAIRQAAAEKSSESIDKEINSFLDSSRKIVSSAGGSTGQGLISALQNDQYSRDVHPHSLVHGQNPFGLGGDGSSLMTAGKPVNDRTNGSSSVSWFLNENKKETMPEQETSDVLEAPEAEEPKEEESGRDKEQVPGEGGKTSSDTSFPSKDHKVMSPAFRYLVPPSFGCDPAPGGSLTYGMNPLPAPFGVYPYTGTYTTAADHAEETDPDDEWGQEDSESVDSDNTELHADEESTWYQEDGYSGGDQYSGTDRDRIIPFRYYGEKDSSREFYGRRRIVFIGDSRTVGMEMSCGGKPEEYWSAEVSMGYNWMVNTGVPRVEDLIDRNTDVVILMGVNDLGNVYRYVDYMNTKAAEWKELGARTFFVSVTPVDDRKSPNAKNSRIESFNAYAQENFQDVYYIDAYNRIRNSYGSPDGIHYDSATYREIYRIIEFSLYQGWYEQDGLWFYFDRGRPLTGWQYLDGQWQYMDGYGVRWIRDGRVGDRICLPLPDSRMKDDVFCPVF